MEDFLELRIGKYLSGEMTGAERDDFEKELAADAQLAKLVQATSLLWNNASASVEAEWNVEEAFTRFKTSLPADASSVSVPAVSSRISNLWLYRAAAAIVLLIGVYVLFFREGAPVHYTYDQVAATPILLKDGSSVVLNKGSELTVYPFSGRKRHVGLKGEAFFEVAHDPSKPFTVACGQTSTEVVGTSFNLKETSTGAEIFVVTGKIIFAPESNPSESVALTAGEAAVYDKQTIKVVANPSSNVLAWRTHDLTFIRMPLSEVVEVISTYFDEKIVVENDGAKTCSINIPLPFKKPEIRAVLSAVADCINATVVKDNDTYIIRGGRVCM